MLNIFQFCVILPLGDRFMTIYDRIKELRLQLKLSQSDLARKLGYKGGSMITKIESGQVDISQKKVLAFARALDTTPAYLMGWTSDPRGMADSPGDAGLSDDTLTPDETRLVSAYRALPPPGKEYLHQQVRAAQLMFGEKSAPVSDSDVI